MSDFLISLAPLALTVMSPITTVRLEGGGAGEQSRPMVLEVHRPSRSRVPGPTPAQLRLVVTPPWVGVRSSISSQLRDLGALEEKCSAVLQTDSVWACSGLPGDGTGVGVCGVNATETRQGARAVRGRDCTGPSLFPCEQLLNSYCVTFHANSPRRLVQGLEGARGQLLPARSAAAPLRPHRQRPPRSLGVTAGSQRELSPPWGRPQSLPPGARLLPSSQVRHWSPVLAAGPCATPCPCSHGVSGLTLCNTFLLNSLGSEKTQQNAGPGTVSAS